MGEEGSESDLSLKVVTNIYRKHTRLWNLNRWLAADLTPQSKCDTTPDSLLTLTARAATLTHVTCWVGKITHRALSDRQWIVRMAPEPEDIIWPVRSPSPIPI